MNNAAKGTFINSQIGTPSLKAMATNIDNGPHDRISPRWKILQKVNNKSALGKIIANNDKKMDEKCSSVKPDKIRTDIPFMKESFLTLLKIRYKEL
ncbi:hypothetical protein [[Flexibacter] sp. ATCC 35208]|uniref:hypothetical protein n=1 Tax=[Flexibacter] sp. ATCC 35208 TaxID=1936242 RepID=UPI0009CC1030|nr:hypothetical protein [[Flexibacter] sp. ATCC 35208]OMP74956.1 hypothetical protein BW716_32740 [[Flexibacter] sp. ATCC 35208]